MGHIWYLSNGYLSIRFQNLGHLDYKTSYLQNYLGWNHSLKMPEISVVPKKLKKLTIFPKRRGSSLLLFLLGVINLDLLLKSCGVPRDLSTVLRTTYEGSVFIVLFLDMRNVVSCHFLTVCTVQVSVPVFSTERSSIEGHNLYVTSVRNRWDVCIYVVMLLSLYGPWPYGPGPMAPYSCFKKLSEIDNVSHISIFFWTLSCNYQ